MSELKPCPFCCGTRIKQYGGGLSQESEITVCTGCYTQVTGHGLWNNRPYENKLKADAIREFLDSVNDTNQLSTRDMQFLSKFAYLYFEGEE